MSNSTGPNLGLFINGNEGEEHYDILMRQFRGFDGLIQCHVLDKDLKTPPGWADDGAMYIIPLDADGAWTARTGQIARRYTLGSGAPAWEFFSPKRGWSCRVEDEPDTDGVPKVYVYTGSEWRVPAVPVTPAMQNPMTTPGDIIVAGENGAPLRLPIGAEGFVLRVIDGQVAWGEDIGSEDTAGMTNPMTSPGDVIYGSVGGVPARLPRGDNGRFLGLQGGLPAWLPAPMENPMTEAGDLVVGGESGAPSRLAKGANGQVLKMVAGVLAWAAESGGGGGMTNPMTAQGDIIVGGVAGEPTRLGRGSNGQVLAIVAGALAWASAMLNPMTAQGDIIVGSASGEPARLGKGADGQVLKMTAGAPAWAAESGGGMTNPMTTEGDLIVGGTAGAPVRLPKGSNGQVLKLVAGALTWAAESGGTGPASTDQLSEGTTNLYFTAARVLAVVLTGLSTSTATAVAATDTLLVAIGKLQAQVTAREQSIAAGTTAQYLNGQKAWVDFATTVRASVLTGLVTNNATVVAAADTLLVAIGKLQAQVTARLALSGGKMTGAINHATPVTLASAATVAIGAAASQTINITGTTTITAFDTIAAGARRRLTFGGALTLTHGPSSLILPGYANIATEVGDTAEFESLGGGNWKCLSYTKVNGRAIAVGASIPSITAANNVNIYAPAVPVVSITGATGIGYLGTGVEGQEVTVVFAGVTPLYHSATLVLPGAANITTAAGDTAKFVFMGPTGVTRCVSYLRAGTPPDGIGVRQTWVDVLASRALDVTYTNDTGRPIQLACLVGPTSSALTVPILYVDGVALSGSYSGVAGNYVPAVTAIVPAGSTYQLVVANGTANLYRFRELR